MTTSERRLSSEAVEARRRRALAAIDAASEALRGLSLSIHSRPELAFEEEHAHAELADFFEQHGFEVVRGAHGVPTAFRAVAGSGSPAIAILCEYDALPGVGHACGHNLIAAAGAAAALGLQAALERGEGSLVVLGTPAEERGGGKIDLINAGAFGGLDAAMMLHPGGGKRIRSGQFRAETHPNAIQSIRITYQGRNAHAAGAPWEGLNALDAVVQAFVNVSMLRQQMRPAARLHGVITDGGQVPNVIPDRTAAYFFVREENLERLEELKPRVLACFEAAAQATGCELEYRWDGNPYSDMQNSTPLVAAFTAHAEALGLEQVELQQAGGGSTDMGNVSYALPSIHPHFGIDAESANHTPGFTAAAGSEAAHADTVRAAKALCLTALDACLDPAVLQLAAAEFEQRRADPESGATPAGT